MQAKPMILSELEEVFKLVNGILWRYNLQQSKWVDIETNNKNNDKYFKTSFKGCGVYVHRVKYALYNKVDLSGTDVIHHIDNVQRNNSIDNLALVTQRTNTALDAVSCLPKPEKGKYVFRKQLRDANGKLVNIVTVTTKSEAEYWCVWNVYNDLYGILSEHYDSILQIVLSGVSPKDIIKPVLLEHLNVFRAK